MMEAQTMLMSGDLELATRKIAEALSETEAVGEAPGAFYWRVKGQLAQFQADLGGVRNAIQQLRIADAKMESGWALPLEVDALQAEDRLAELRVMYEKAGANRRLCELLCDEGRPVEGLKCLEQYPPPSGAGTAATVGMGLGSGGYGRNLKLAKCRYLAGDLDGAGKAALEERTDARRWERYEEGVLANTYFMRVRSARGEAVQAIASLRADLAEAESKHAKALAFEVALALGEVELGAGRPEGRSRLLKLEQEAKSKEFVRVARLAREALQRNGAPPPRAH